MWSLTFVPAIDAWTSSGNKSLLSTLFGDELKRAVDPEKPLSSGGSMYGHYSCRQAQMHSDSMLVVAFFALLYDEMSAAPRYTKHWAQRPSGKVCKVFRW